MQLKYSNVAVLISALIAGKECSGSSAMRKLVFTVGRDDEGDEPTTGLSIDGLTFFFGADAVVAACSSGQFIGGSGDECADESDYEISGDIDIILMSAGVTLTVGEGKLVLRSISAIGDILSSYELVSLSAGTMSSDTLLGDLTPSAEIGYDYPSSFGLDEVLDSDEKFLYFSVESGDILTAFDWEAELVIALNPFLPNPGFYARVCGILPPLGVADLGCLAIGLAADDALEMESSGGQGYMPDAATGNVYLAGGGSIGIQVSDLIDLSVEGEMLADLDWDALLNLNENPIKEYMMTASSYGTVSVGQISVTCELQSTTVYFAEDPWDSDAYKFAYQGEIKSFDPSICDFGPLSLLMDEGLSMVPFEMTAGQSSTLYVGYRYDASGKSTALASYIKPSVIGTATATLLGYELADFQFEVSTDEVSLSAKVNFGVSKIAVEGEVFPDTDPLEWKFAGSVDVTSSKVSLVVCSFKAKFTINLEITAEEGIHFEAKAKGCACGQCDSVDAAVEITSSGEVKASAELFGENVKVVV